MPGLFLLNLNMAAQQLSEEPAGGMDEATDDVTVFLPPSRGAIPSALNFYPLNTYYTSWDTLFVRRYSDPAVSISDSIALPLTTPEIRGFCFPAKGDFLSPFGYRGRRVHSGVDIKLNLYDTVQVAFDGIVRMARYYKGYGNCVVVRHYNGLETLYGHLSKIKVKVNQELKAGDLVGLGGRTGRATCNHLHFETRFRGQAFNPKQLIDFESFSLLTDTLIITPRTFGYSRDYMPGNHITETSTAVASNSVNSSKDTPDHNAKKFHTIKKGDTLYAISRKYNTNVRQLCSLNGIKENKVLQVGKRIRVK